MKKIAVIVLLVFAAVVFFTLVFLNSNQDQQPVEKSRWELEILRIKELFRLTDMFGDKIWPGFDTRKIPIAVNYNYRQQVLINHPQPPKEFRVLKGIELEGQPIMIYGGSTSFVTFGYGFSCDMIATAFGMGPKEGSSTEKFLAMMIHECFHVFQGYFRKPVQAQGEFDAFPIYDIQQAALIGLENRILYTALQQKDAKEMRRLAKMFVAVRSQRRENLSRGACHTEDLENFSEGTAFYTETRLSQLLRQAGGLKSPLVDADPDYKGFSEAEAFYRDYLEGILPPKDKPVTLGHHIYQNGMAQALLLDRVRPGWKQEMSEAGITQFKLLQRQFPLEKDEITKLVTAAQEKFDYEKILGQQDRLIRERVSIIHGYLDAPGRRYRICLAENPGRFRWKPRHPIYELPGKYLSKTQQESVILNKKKMNVEFLEVFVLVKGIERLEIGDLVFEGGEVPVINWPNLGYFEWNDPSPAADKSDMKIQCDKQEKDIYTNLILTTGGFSLRVGRARIMWSDKIVEIHSLPNGEKVKRNKGACSRVLPPG